MSGRNGLALFTVGLVLTCISAGVILGQTLFVTLSALIGVTVLGGGSLWFATGLIITFLGMYAFNKQMEEQ